MLDYEGAKYCAPTKALAITNPRGPSKHIGETGSLAQQALRDDFLRFATKALAITNPRGPSKHIGETGSLAQQALRDDFLRFATKALRDYEPSGFESNVIKMRKTAITL